MNCRIIAKFLFFLVFFGLFMPMCCDKNGFQLADSGWVKSDAIFAIYAIFVSSIIGLIIGVLLLLKKPVPIIIDWIVTTFCFLCTVIAFYIAGYVNDNIDYFQSGVYMVLVGAILVMLAQIISPFVDNVEAPIGAPLNTGTEEKSTYNGNTLDNSFDPVNGAVDNIFIVKNEMKLYESDLNYGSVVSELKIGEKLQFIKTGANVSVAGIYGQMVNVKTENNKTGWCFSGFLTKDV